jgi:hypothetical protein
LNLPLFPAGAYDCRIGSAAPLLAGRFSGCIPLTIVHLSLSARKALLATLKSAFFSRRDRQSNIHMRVKICHKGVESLQMTLSDEKMGVASLQTVLFYRKVGLARLLSILFRKKMGVVRLQHPFSRKKYYAGNLKSGFFFQKVSP